jgi:hypothetical protein
VFAWIAKQGMLEEDENDNAEISSHAQKKPLVQKFPVTQTLLPPICWLAMSEI